MFLPFFRLLILQVVASMWDFSFKNKFSKLQPSTKLQTLVLLKLKMKLLNLSMRRNLTNLMSLAMKSLNLFMGTILTNVCFRMSLITNLNQMLTWTTKNLKIIKCLVIKLKFNITWKIKRRSRCNKSLTHLMKLTQLSWWNNSMSWCFTSKTRYTMRKFRLWNCKCNSWLVFFQVIKSKVSRMFQEKLLKCQDRTLTNNTIPQRLHFKQLSRSTPELQNQSSDSKVRCSTMKCKKNSRTISTIPSHKTLKILQLLQEITQTLKDKAATLTQETMKNKNMKLNCQLGWEKWIDQRWELTWKNWNSLPMIRKLCTEF